MEALLHALKNVKLEVARAAHLLGQLHNDHSNLLFPDSVMLGLIPVFRCFLTLKQ